MINKNSLINNRIYLEQNRSNIITTLNKSISISNDNPIDVIKVNDASNLKEKGYIFINNEKFYYSSRTSNTLLNVYRNINNITISTHENGSNVIQTRKSINDFNNSSNLSGWYVDGYSKNASLKVGKSPVIMPGVIRYNNGTFEGCISDDGSDIKWVTFNAEKGDKGDDGDINTTINFEHISNININNSNSGNIIKKTDVDTDSSNILVRSLISGNTTVNQLDINTMDIETTSNNIILSSNSHPFIYDFTKKIDNIKGDPTNDNLLNCYGTQIKVNIIPSNNVKKGQIVILQNYTLNSNTYYGVKPFTYSLLSDLDKYKSTNDTNSIMTLGISRSDGTDSDKINILMDGIGIIKVGNNVSGLGTFTTITDVEYIGRPLLLDKDGYTFCNNTEPILNEPYIELGHNLETGTGIFNTNNYVLIKLKPKIIMP